MKIGDVLKEFWGNYTSWYVLVEENIVEHVGIFITPSFYHHYNGIGIKLKLRPTMEKCSFEEGHKIKLHLNGNNL